MTENEERQLRKKEYEKYLKSPHWKNFKKRIYSKFDVCVYCKTKRKLNIHHLTYERRGRERESDVVVLCKTCHFKVHDKILLVEEILVARSEAIQLRRALKKKPKTSRKKKNAKKLKLAKEQRKILNARVCVRCLRPAKMRICYKCHMSDLRQKYQKEQCEIGSTSPS